MTQTFITNDAPKKTAADIAASVAFELGRQFGRKEGAAEPGKAAGLHNDTKPLAEDEFADVDLNAVMEDENG